MEIDVDDFLQGREDNLDFRNDAPGEGEQNNGDRRAPRRRNIITNEFAGKVAALDDSLLDPSLDWYLRIDLVDEKSALQQRERERQLNVAIERLKCARNQLQSNVTSSDDADDGIRPSAHLTGKILHYPPYRSSNWMPVTTPTEKTRLYITLKPTRVNTTRETRHFGTGVQLLGHDFQDIVENAMKLNGSNTASEESTSEELVPPPADTCTIYFTEPMYTEPIVSVEGTPKSESVLWVEKYKPRGYIDLLSDDGVNRTLLTWLKLWDECVFGRKRSNQPASNSINRFTGPSVFREHAAKRAGFRNGKFNKGPMNAFNNADQVPTTLDSLKRPLHKIALLSGPPGIGKTTLAHVVAKHAGYFVQELNASDDRTLDAFKKHLEGATQMQTTLDSTQRPHCLVIDEIDGAPSHSVNYLVALATTVGDGDEANGKGKSRAMVLRRPIICICNDLYAPALRELRKVALVVQAPPVELSRMTERLCHIARRESVFAEPGVFDLMCSKAGADVRSCINTLQLLTSGVEFRKNNKRLTSIQVSEAKLGIKDMQRSLFSTLQDVFQLPKTQKRSSTSELSASALSIRVNAVLRACEECGDEDRLFAGIFENYLAVDYRDPRMESTFIGLDWLSFVDLLDRAVAQSQIFELKRYNRYLAVVFHLLFANRQFTKLAYPHMVQEAPFKILRTRATLHALLSEVKCAVRAFLDCNVLVTDILPLVLELIQPKLRPVNVQLYNDQEKATLRRVVDIMRDYNLTYRQQRSVRGDYELILEPPVEDVVRISEPPPEKVLPVVITSSKQRTQLPDSIKQIVAHELELAKVRNNETKKTAERQQDIAGKGQKLSEETTRQSSPSAVAGTQAKQDHRKSVERRLFGVARGIGGSDVTKGPHGVANVQSSSSSEGNRLWFKYNEGSSNAVRRCLRVADLL